MDAYTARDIIIATDFQGTWTLTDFADGTVAQLTAPNELSNMTTGYNGNSLAAHNEPGRQRALALRLVKGSSDDKRFNLNYNLWKNHDIRYKPLEMEFTKQIAHSDGSITNDKVTCFFGNPGAQPEQTTDVAGNTDQVVSVYSIKFGNSERSM